MKARILPGLIQDTFLTLKAKEYSLRRGAKGWTVWRLSPVGHVWLADFADKTHAVNFITHEMGQEDARPR